MGILRSRCSNRLSIIHAGEVHIESTMPWRKQAVISNHVGITAAALEPPAAADSASHRSAAALLRALSRLAAGSLGPDQDFFELHARCPFACLL